MLNVLVQSIVEQKPSLLYLIQIFVCTHRLIAIARVFCIMWPQGVRNASATNSPTWHYFHCYAVQCICCDVAHLANFANLSTTNHNRALDFRFAGVAKKGYILLLYQLLKSSFILYTYLILIGTGKQIDRQMVLFSHRSLYCTVVIDILIDDTLYIDMQYPQNQITVGGVPQLHNVDD